MDAHVKDVVRAMTEASDQERILFPDVVKALAEVGIERYHADLVCATKTYYQPEGAFEVVSCHSVSRPADLFSAEGVEAAVRASQSGAIKYREFCARIAVAGCVGYAVSLAGRRAVYYGRTGDSHTEWFPGAR
jgi:uncharacterized protein YbcV (DUF1398 family)